jgi:hypothetical protein
MGIGWTDRTFKAENLEATSQWNFEDVLKIFDVSLPDPQQKIHNSDSRLQVTRPYVLVLQHDRPCLRPFDLKKLLEVAGLELGTREGLRLAEI